MVVLSSKSANPISRNSRNCLNKATNKQLWFSDKSDWSDWSDPSDNFFLKQNSHEHQNHSAHPLF